jgi:hypothetical protein
MDIKGKRAIVLGGTSGIGRAPHNSLSNQVQAFGSMGYLPAIRAQTCGF